MRASPPDKATSRLVGGAYNGTRWDLVLLFRLGTPLLEAPFRPVWDRGPQGALALAAMGAFVVLESKEHAQKRGAKPIAKLSQVLSSRNNRAARRYRHHPAIGMGRYREVGEARLRRGHFGRVRRRTRHLRGKAGS